MSIGILLTLRNVTSIKTHSKTINGFKIFSNATNIEFNT